MHANARPLQAWAASFGFVSRLICASVGRTGVKAVLTLTVVPPFKLTDAARGRQQISTSVKIRRATVRKALQFSVGIVPRLVRSTSCTPSRSSSDWTRRLSEDRWMPSILSAREKLSVSAVITACRGWRISEVNVVLTYNQNGILQKSFAPPGRE